MLTSYGAGMLAIVAPSQHSPGIEFGGGVIDFVSLARLVGTHRSLNIVFPQKAASRHIAVSRCTCTLFHCLYSRDRLSLSFFSFLQGKTIGNRNQLNTI
jgi:hypothetical protein